jgi:pSer/pThr/pTyr-binding forkhead associated (FHA) protein
MLQASLEIKSGKLAGKTIQLKNDQVIRVGRTSRSDFVIADDTFLSSLHFILEISGTVCRLRDGGSANGTRVNGARVTEAVLRDGDEISAGHTTFVVRVVESPESNPSEEPSQILAASLPSGAIAPSAKDDRFSVGSWSFSAIPSGWETLEQHGIRRTGKDIFPSNAVVSEEPLPAGKTLREYIDSQIQILQSLIPEMKAESPTPATVSGAEEALDMLIRHASEDGQQILQRQLYVRANQLVGVLTFTTTEKDFATVQPAFESILSAAIFKPQ